MLGRACRAFHENERCLLPFVKRFRTRDSVEYSSLRARYILQSTSTSDLPAEFPVPLPKKLHDPTSRHVLDGVHEALSIPLPLKDKAVSLRFLLKFP